MPTDDFQRRATSFGAVADDYETARPGYPEAAVRWLAGSEAARVLDLGAGTGKLTRALVQVGHEVVAVDPSEQMLHQLQSHAPDVEVLVGSAEAIPQPDASVDVVTAAQAFHWFDPATALPEIARVLRPGGRLALVWNQRDENVAWTVELWNYFSPDEARYVAPTEFGAPFGPIETAEFGHTQQLDRDALLKLVRSRSYVAVRSPAERAALLHEVSAFYDRIAGRRGLELPYATRCFRSTRG